MHNNRFLLILILGLLSAIGPFSIDTYLSGFPAIAADLHVTVGEVAYSLSSFFIGICTGQLICGPLLDRFGRKIPLMIGLVIYVIASMGCAMATSVEMLIGLRFLQALGGCVGIVAPRAIVRDMFPVEQNAKIFSLLILILGVSPIIAPSVGSLLITQYGWHSVFWLQTSIGVMLLIAVFFLLPESKKADPSVSLYPKDISRNFWNVLKEPRFFTYALAGAMAYSSIYAYLAGSPYVFMQIFKVSELQYGYIFGLLAAGLIGSSQLNNLLLQKYKSTQIVRTFLWIQKSVGLLLCIGSALGWLNLYSTLFLIFLFLSCQGFSQPNATALSLASFTKEVGSASALMGALQMGFGSFASAMVGVLSNGSAVPMTGVMATCALIGLTIFSVGRSVLEGMNNTEAKTGNIIV